MLENLNEEQRNALSVLEGAILVTAGAGSGKTRLLTHRIAYLVKEKNVSPYNILAITFTNKAANEMKERICAMTSNGDRIWISTIHSMCVKILRNEIEYLNEGYTRYFTIYSQDDCYKEIKKIVKESSIPSEEVDGVAKQVAYHLSCMKNENLQLNEYAEFICADSNADDIIKFMKEYSARLKRANAVDFDDLMVLTMKVFNDKDILFKYSSRFQYIHVDEFQDTNTIQYELVKRLASVNGNVFVVGDEDQCIYGWRGAKVKNIALFIKEFENCKVFKLEQNYRSTKNILNTANILIKKNSERIEKTLWTNNEDGANVICKTFNTDREEADFVCRTIYELVNYNGYKLKDIAVLMRLNALSRLIEEKLLSLNLPHRVYGGFKFFDRAEIMNVVAYLRLTVNENDDASFNRVVNFPKRAIGEASVSSLAEVAKNNQICLYKAIDIAQSLNTLSSATQAKLNNFKTLIEDLKIKKDELSISDFIAYVIDKTGIKAEYEKNLDDNRERLLNVNQLIQSAGEFENLNEGAKLFDYLESISLIADIDESNEEDKITLATVHAVKGLEFKVVFIVGAEDKIFPIKRCDGSDDIEEERRLMYVAITRAQQKLFISHCQTRFMYGKTAYMNPSEFLAECKLALPSTSGYKTAYNKAFGTTSNYSSNSYNSSYNNTSFNSQTTISKTNFSTQIKTGFNVGVKVSHPSFGRGTIVAVGGTKNDIVTIAFEKVGNKQLLTEFAPLTILKD